MIWSNKPVSILISSYIHKYSRWHQAIINSVDSCFKLNWNFLCKIAPISININIGTITSNIMQIKHLKPHSTIFLVGLNALLNMDTFNSNVDPDATPNTI